jgi:hypothetical protein
MKRFLVCALLFTSCSFWRAMPEAGETPTPSPEAVVTPKTAERMTPLPSAVIQPEEVMAALSLDSMMGYLEALTEIEPYSGWRNSATIGEKKAVDYVASVLDTFENLKAMGMTVEEEDFKVFMANEIWQAELRITVEGEEYDIPANAPRGPTDDTEIARSFDSDGALTDLEPNPLRREGSVEYISGVNETNSLQAGSAKDVILLVDYAVVDRSLLKRKEAERRASLLIRSQPLALVLVTSWFPHPGESHGAFAGDVSAFSWVNDNHTPILVTRLEEYAPAGVTSMEELVRIEKAIVVVDTDVVSPGQSRNLVAMIPGRDDTAALIFGAHIDSPNNPGAMDDGSGSAILLEMARVLNETGYQPGVTTYLVWFGSEELFLYGSQTFAARHQELVDKAIAMMQIDCLTRPLDGLTGAIAFSYWSYREYGDPSYPLPTFLEEQASALDIAAWAHEEPGASSDNSSFQGFGVPNVNVIRWVVEEESAGGIHNAGVIHAPYDDMERVRESQEAFFQMAQIAMKSLVSLGEERPDLRLTQKEVGRVVFVGTHTEVTGMTPAALTTFAMALESMGLDVDLIPYGASLTASHLSDADMVIVLPSIDYPSEAAGSIDWYDVGWRGEEIEILRQYVEEGGLLVLTNSAHRLKYFYYAPFEENEDWSDMNDLAQPFGVEFLPGEISPESAELLTHPLTAGLSRLRLTGGNAVPFAYRSGQDLARAGEKSVVALIPFGDQDGEVLVVGDLGIFDRRRDEGRATNLDFWLNLAEYAQER